MGDQEYFDMLEETEKEAAGAYEEMMAENERQMYEEE